MPLNFQESPEHGQGPLNESPESSFVLVKVSGHVAVLAVNEDLALDSASSEPDKLGLQGHIETMAGTLVKNTRSIP